jgi:hypothetical protein
MSMVGSSALGDDRVRRHRDCVRQNKPLLKTIPRVSIVIVKLLKKVEEFSAL